MGPTIDSLLVIPQIRPIDLTIARQADDIAARLRHEAETQAISPQRPALGH